MNRFILFFLLTSALSIAQTQNTVTIGILDEKLTQDSEPLLKQLKKDITDVVGQGTTVILNEVLFNNHDVVTAKENYTTLLKNNTDIIIAFGVVNTIMLYQEKSYAKPTVIVGAINNDFVDIPKNQTKSGINNLTYLITPFYGLKFILSFFHGRLEAFDLSLKLLVSDKILFDDIYALCVNQISLADTDAGRGIDSF